MDKEADLAVKLGFQAGFSREACRNAWGTVGAAPLMRACLEHKKVRKLLGDGTDAYQALLQNIQVLNAISMHTLALAIISSCLCSPVVVQSAMRQDVSHFI